MKTKIYRSNGYELNEWVSVDFTSANLKAHGLKAKRTWKEETDVKIIHFRQDNTVLVQAGNCDRIIIPISLLPIKSDHKLSLREVCNQAFDLTNEAYDNQVDSPDLPMVVFFIERAKQCANKYNQPLSIDQIKTAQTWFHAQHCL